MFLATTALSDFWEKDQEILFLGSWCLRHDRRTEWQGLKYHVLPCPWDDRKRFHEAAEYLDGYGDRLVEGLSANLNSVHGIQYSQRAWRILIGPWLARYLHAVYDRYVLLQTAFAKYPELHTVVLAPTSFRVPEDTQTLAELMGGDAYNLQIFSQLLAALGHAYPGQTLTADLCSSETDARKRRWRGRAKFLLKKGFRYATETIGRAIGNEGAVALCDMYMPLSARWAIIFRSRFRALPWEMERNEWSFAVAPPVFDERRKAIGVLPASNEFEQVFAQLLVLNFPPLYLESFRQAREETLRTAPSAPKVVVSAVGWDVNEPLKFFAAEAAEQGGRLVSVQHGGAGYGTFRSGPYERHELRVVDSFMGWGWGTELERCRKLPSPQLSRLRAQGCAPTRARAHGTVLFIATAHPRYVYRFHSTPVGGQWEEYFAWELRFFKTLSPQLRRAALYRAYPYDFGFAVRDRIVNSFPEVRLDTGGHIHRRLNRTRLAVIDHPATAYMETLAANIPTVLFWDPNRWEVRATAEPYFQSLRQAGILWDSPEAAAAKVTEVYQDPWTWWAGEDLQAVRRTFVERYASGSDDWLEQWNWELRREAVLARS